MIKQFERQDGEFQTRIVTDIKGLSAGNQPADEEVKSSYGYPKGYKIRGIEKQISILRQFLPGIGSINEKFAKQPLPANAEGWFAIPRWQSVAKTNNEAVRRVLELIRRQRHGKLYNRRKGKLGAKYITESEHTVRKLKQLSDQQKNYDILVVAAQFGLRHRNRSVPQARTIFTPNEFGLGAFEIGCMLLTHPERLQYCNDLLWVDCAGNIYHPPGIGNAFLCTPIFIFRNGRVEFDTRLSDVARSYFGSASGFLQQ